MIQTDYKTMLKQAEGLTGFGRSFILLFFIS